MKDVLLIMRYVFDNDIKKNYEKTRPKNIMEKFGEEKFNRFCRFCEGKTNEEKYVDEFWIGKEKSIRLTSKGTKILFELEKIEQNDLLQVGIGFLTAIIATATIFEFLNNLNIIDKTIVFIVSFITILSIGIIALYVRMK